jgi:hypothetical protein
MLLSCRSIDTVWRNVDYDEHSCDNNDRHREFTALSIPAQPNGNTPTNVHRYSTARTPVRSCVLFSTPSFSTACLVPSSRRRSRSSMSPWCLYRIVSDSAVVNRRTAGRRGSECAAHRRGEGECVLEGPRERRAEKGRGAFVCCSHVCVDRGLTDESC